MQLLELFKGTGSVGKVARKMGFNVVSVDFDEKFKPDILTDILDWDYKSYTHIPDFIWASPPCNTYSTLAYPFKERDVKTTKPLSDRAKLGTRILHKTLEIIEYFSKKNPNMGVCIENPRGMMRNDPKIKKLILNTTHYCNYGDKRTKPTDFFSNYPLNLSDIICKGSVQTISLKLNDRYKIPPKLIKDILDEYLKIKKNI